MSKEFNWLRIAVRLTVDAVAFGGLLLVIAYEPWAAHTWLRVVAAVLLLLAVILSDGLVELEREFQRVYGHCSKCARLKP